MVKSGAVYRYVPGLCCAVTDRAGDSGIECHCAILVSVIDTFTDITVVCFTDITFSVLHAPVLIFLKRDTTAVHVVQYFDSVVIEC